MASIFVPVKDREPTWCHWFYWVLLVAVLVGGLVIRLFLPSLPFMDLDTSSYLYPSVNLFATGEYSPTYRNFLYPTFLSAVLWVFPHFNALSYVQHIFGVCTAALVVVIFFRARAFLPSGKLLDWATRIVALLAAYLFLFSRTPIVLEHTIRPEALFSTACVLTVLAGIEFSRRVFLEKSIDVWSSFWLLFLIIFSIGTYYIKPAWGFAIGTSLFPVLFACIWIPGRWVWKFGLSLLGFVLVFIIFVVPEYFLREPNAQKSFLSETLFCTHAEFFQDILERDALCLSPKLSERAHFLKFTQEIRAAILNPSRHRYGLSLNPDDVMYRGPLEELSNGLTSVKKDFSINKFYCSYYFWAWWEHPLLMLKKVFNQMEFFYSPKKTNVYDKNNEFKLSEKYRESLEGFSQIPHPYWQPAADYYKSLQEANFDARAPIRVCPGKMKKVFIFVNSIFFPLFALSLLTAGLVFLSRIRLVHLRPAAWMVSYLASFNLANCLTISVVHMMDVSRYHFNQIAMSLVSQGFELLFLVALLSNCISDWRKKNL